MEANIRTLIEILTQRVGKVKLRALTQYNKVFEYMFKLRIQRISPYETEYRRATWVELD